MHELVDAIVAAIDKYDTDKVNRIRAALPDDQRQAFNAELALNGTGAGEPDEATDEVSDKGWRAEVKAAIQDAIWALEGIDV